MGDSLVVLVVDGEAESAEELRALLGTDCQVKVAKSLKEGLGQFHQDPTIGVVIASHSASLDAVDMLGACYRENGRSHVRRMLVASRGSSTLFQRAVNLAHVHYIAVRPLNSAQFLLTVLRLTGEAQEAREALEEHSTRQEVQAVSGHRDNLTGLLSHRSFYERGNEALTQAKDHGEQLSVIYCDIDRFAELNLGRGHRFGDDVLKAIGALLQDFVASRRGALASRFAGQQFVVLLPKTGLEEALVHAEYLRNRVANGIMPQGVSITISVGVSAFPGDADCMAALLDTASNAMLQAKREGRNRVMSHSLLATQDATVDLAMDACEFPIFHSCMQSLVLSLHRDKTLACLYIDLSRLNQVQSKFGASLHAQLFETAGQVLAGLRGDKLRSDDLICCTDDMNGYLCFLSAPRFDGTSPEFSKMVQRLEDALEAGLASSMKELSLGSPQVSVGLGRVLANPLIRGERLVHRLVKEVKHNAKLEWQRLSKERKNELQQLILGRQLGTVFQPIVNLSNATCFAYEALTRVPPKSPLTTSIELFALAEAVDLTMELDRACFEAALRHARDCGPVGTLFVRLLPRSFYDFHFIESEVMDLLRRADLVPANVVFELAENLAIEDLSAFRRTLRRYTSMGFGVAVSDVGARHSHLAAVLTLEPQYIKLCDILCRGLVQSSIKREMVRSLVQTAAAANIVAIGQGVESHEDLQALYDVGVRFAQGYYLAEPHVEPKGLAQKTQGVIAALAHGQTGS